MLAAGAGRAQGLETDLALQTGRRRGEALRADEPVLARMPCPVGAGADPLDTAAPALGERFGGSAAQPQEQRTPGARTLAGHLLDYLDLDAGLRRLEAQPLERLRHRQAAFRRPLGRGELQQDHRQHSPRVL